MTVKISLGIFFARIVVAQWHLMLIYITLGVNVFSSAAAFFYVIFRCGHDVDRYVLQQLKEQCAPRGLDRFMAYQSGEKLCADLLLRLLTDKFNLSGVHNPHRPRFRRSTNHGPLER